MEHSLCRSHVAKNAPAAFEATGFFLGVWLPVLRIDPLARFGQGDFFCSFAECEFDVWPESA